MTRRTLSITTQPAVPIQRLTRQTITVLTFIHQFRHVTTSHVQSCLEHANPITTHNLLTALRARGLIDRHYTKHDRATNQVASYYLTPAGRDVLKQRDPTGRFRRLQSLQADANARLPQRSRCHTLADCYVSFKRQYPGACRFYTSHDLKVVEDIPKEVPDGYVVVRTATGEIQGHYIEIYGWGRPTHVQRRRLSSYIEYYEPSYDGSDATKPDVYILTASAPVQARLVATLRLTLESSFVDETKFYTAVAGSLHQDTQARWKPVIPV